MLALWTQPNALGQPDPAIALRITGPACVVHIAIAPNYPVIVPGGFGGDFYRVWKNAFDFGVAGCPSSAPGDPAQIAKGWRTRAELDAWRTGFSFSLVLDGARLQPGFGPALLLETLPDGQIVVR